MCGIAGIFNYANARVSVNCEVLLRMRDYMTNRGPDDSGLWLSPTKRMALAHRRLAIIDLTAAGHQPMSTQDGRLHISFNGEIYNYQELRAELEQKGSVFHSHSDTEVLLLLYRSEGTAMFSKLRGMFAIAIWDEQEQNLILARDQFGIKPLYYADNEKSIRFASQVKALLAGGEVNTLPEPAGLVGFYLWGFVPEPYTRYKGVRSLPAGSFFKIGASGRKEEQQFFSLSAELATPNGILDKPSWDEAQEQLYNALRETVKYHLIADVPVGVFLSAGLDSTTITALAKETGLAELRTVTLGFNEYKGTENDETILAQLVAEKYGTNHSTRWVQKADFKAEISHLLAAMDQPSIDGVNSYFVCKAAKDAGLKVALSGLGGDELFGGYPAFQQIPKLVKLLRPLSSIPQLGKGFRFISAPVLKHFSSPKYAGLLEYGSDVAGAYLLRRGLYMPWELPQILDPDLVKEGWQELKALANLKQSINGIDNPRLQISALETTWYMRNQLLRDVDWASMAHSLEVRVPLVDVNLLRTVTSLVNSGYEPNKRNMASSMKSPLPNTVLNRAKTGFSVPVKDWLLETINIQESRGLRGWALAVMGK